jgi:SSS family solute:Na+ symporter
VIVVVYLAALAAVGVYFSRRQRNLDEFFRARQSMAWLPVGLSLMAALDSAIDYLMQPSATIRYGLVLLIGVTSWIFLYPWVARVTLPFFRRLNVYTTYEYLEARFDVRVRRSPPASSSSGGSAGWRRRSMCRASRFRRRPAAACRWCRWWRRSARS